MRLNKMILGLIFVPGVAFADCASIVQQLKKDGEAGLKLNYNTQYDAGMDKVSDMQGVLGDLQALRRDEECTKEAWREFFKASLALAPFDQESENAQAAAQAVHGNKELHGIMDDTLMQFKDTYPNSKSPIQWCKGEVFQQQEAAAECDLKKKKCPEPTINYAACAKISEKVR